MKIIKSDALIAFTSESYSNNKEKLISYFKLASKLFK